MEGTRKNVWSEYKELGKWGFVPKLGVTLLAALIILSLAGCKNTADGGVGSSGGGGAAPAAPAPIMPDLVDGFESGVAYAFYDGERRVGRYSTTDDAKTFSEIKQKIGVAAIESVENDSSFLGWQIEETGELVASDEQSFSSDTKFVASYKEAGNSKDIDEVDILGEEGNTYGWYSKEKNAFLFFSENTKGMPGGDGYILYGKGYVESDSIVSDFLKLEKEMYKEFKANGNSDNYKELKSKYDNDTMKFELIAWYTDDIWGESTFINGFSYKTWVPFSYYLNANGTALLDYGTNEIAYRRVTIND